jgi:hypothetical protein
VVAVGRIGAVLPIVAFRRLTGVVAAVAGIATALVWAATRLGVVLIVSGVAVLGRSTATGHRKGGSAGDENHRDDRRDELLQGPQTSF